MDYNTRNKRNNRPVRTMPLPPMTESQKQGEIMRVRKIEAEITACGKHGFFVKTTIDAHEC